MNPVMTSEPTRAVPPSAAHSGQRQSETVEKTLTLTSRLDRIGFSASMLCAVHCAAMPLVITALPLAGLEALTHPAVEGAMILLGVIVGTASLSHGYRHHHHRLSAIAVLLAGFALIAAGHLLVPETLEAVVTPVGAATVALSHLLNWRLCRKYGIHTADAHIHAH